MTVPKLSGQLLQEGIGIPAFPLPMTTASLASISQSLPWFPSHVLSGTWAE